MLISYTRSQTSVILRVKIRNSSVTTGAGLTGLTSASAGLIISTIADNEATATTYTVAGSTVETITTLGTYAAPTATKCRFKEVDATNHPGVYEIQLADARFAVASCKSLLVSISGATNAAQCDAVIPLTEIDPYDNVRLGITALPNAAAEAAGGLYTRGTGAGQINQPANGLIDVNVENWNTTAVPAEHTLGYPIVTIKDGTGTGEINTNGGAIALVDLVTTTTNLTNAPTAGDLTATMKASVNTEVDTAIADARLDELLVNDSDIDGAAPPAVGSVFFELMTKTAGSFTYDQTTDSVEAIRDRGDAAWITATSVTVSDKTGFKLASDGLAQVVAWTVNITGTLSGTVGGIAGTITTLDALDTAQDAQHAITQADLPTRPTRGVQLDDVMFMMVDATDLNTPETGITVTATISKDGGAFAACTNAVSEVSGGWYKIALTATEMTANSIALKMTGTGCAQRNITIRTQPT